MKKFNINEDDRSNILKMHQTAILNEQGGLSTLSASQSDSTKEPVNRTIQDLQTLVGLTGSQADNILGPKTLEALKSKISTVAAAKSKSVTPEKKDEVDPSVLAKIKQYKQMEYTSDQIVKLLKDTGISDEVIVKAEPSLKTSIETLAGKQTQKLTDKEKTMVAGGKPQGEPFAGEKESSEVYDTKDLFG